MTFGSEQTDQLLLVKDDTSEFQELADYLTRSKGHTHDFTFEVGLSVSFITRKNADNRSLLRSRISSASLATEKPSGSVLMGNLKTVTVVCFGTAAVVQTSRVYLAKAFASLHQRLQYPVTCSVKEFILRICRQSQRITVTQIYQMARLCCCCARQNLGSQCMSWFMPIVTQILMRRTAARYQSLAKVS